MDARNPLAEARRIAGDSAWVLEPSPPAVDDGQWFADDPVAAGDLEWGKWLTDHPEHGDWAAERWLGAYRRLPPPPSTCVETRRALHRLAVHVVSPARQRRANGKMALRWTLGGIGSPFYGQEEQVRLDGNTIVRQQGATASAAPITSLRDAAAFVIDGPPEGAWAKDLDAPAAGDIDEPLSVDPDAAAFLGDWYGFAWSVLEAVRADAESVDASRVQLWPEHFDAAFDCLRPERRSTLGVSPGDAAEPEPYLYVIAPKTGDLPGDLWDATSFKGAIMRLGELVDAVDQRGAALQFFRECRFAVDQ
jgi:hypothetical protein